MKQSTQKHTSNQRMLILLVGLSLLMAGCSTFRGYSCEQFEEQRKRTDYLTLYKYSETDSEFAKQNFKALPRRKNVVVRSYKMRVSPENIYPCNHLTIHKEIYLQRRNRAAFALEEIREFYTDKGQLIASKTESVGDQLRTTGYYSGETPLPIPQNAPAGKYRIVSKLVIRATKKSRAVVLAKTSTTFQVTSRK